jgi:hypothetical protein
MVFDNEKRAIPEPVALGTDGKFAEQSYITVQEAEKLVVDWTPAEERKAKLKFLNSRSPLISEWILPFSLS